MDEQVWSPRRVFQCLLISSIVVEEEEAVGDGGVVVIGDYCFKRQTKMVAENEGVVRMLQWVW